MQRNIACGEGGFEEQTAGRANCRLVLVQERTNCHALGRPIPTSAEGRGPATLKKCPREALASVLFVLNPFLARNP